MGRYVELARRTIETLHGEALQSVASESSAMQDSPYEINERNEKSLYSTSVRNAQQLMTVGSWKKGVARLASALPPRDYPARAWEQLIVDAERFLDDWATQAVSLGWQDWEIFGCHRRAPWGRLQGMGLVLLLRGVEIAAMTATAAAIRTRTGARQTFRRQPRDPLDPAERCLVWELDDER
jgi:hypothetical protein